MSRWNLGPARHRWAQLSAREQAWIRVATVLVVLAVLWQVGLSPALRVWRDSPERRAQLDRQHTELLALQAQARSLQSQPTLSRQEAQQSLAQLTRDVLPGAQLTAVGDQQRIVVKNASGSSLAQWLSGIRQTVQASVVDMQLQRSPTSASTSVQWDGQITLQWPTRGAP